MITTLLDLPEAILCNIFKRLPVNSVCYLRCVSKTLLDIVQSPFFVSLHSRLSILTNAHASDHPPLTLRFVGDSCAGEYRPSPYSMPTYMASECDPLQHALERLHYDGSKGSFIVSDILSTTDDSRYSVHFSYCNLFLLTRKRGNCFLIDPFTAEVLRLPWSDIHYKHGAPTHIFRDVYGMGFDSKTSAHKILRLSQIGSLINIRDSNYYSCVAQMLELGTNSWRELPLQTLNSCKYLKDLHSNKSICAYGDMHWLILQDGSETLMAKEEEGIVSFDFTKEEFYRTPTLGIPCLKLEYTHLIALRGSMALVIVDTELWDVSDEKSIDIWVMKDYRTKEWVRDYTIHVHEPLPEDFFACCGEWEDGIFFQHALTYKSRSFFVDLRCNSMQVIPLTERSDAATGLWICQRILSVNRSLLSLKTYGDLVQAPNLLKFSKYDLWIRDYLCQRLQIPEL